MKTQIRILFIMLTTLLIVSCGGDDDDNDTSIIDELEDNSDYSTLLLAIDTAELRETLDDLDATFTLFAPDNDAFAAFLTNENITAEELLASENLADILLYHVIPNDAILAAEAIGSAGNQVVTANMDSIHLSLIGESLLVNLSTVTATDTIVDNGVIHELNGVLTPPADPGEPTLNIVETADEDGRFTTLLAAATAANLAGALSDPDAELTVFAPTDDAFSVLGQGTLNALLDPNNIDELTDILEKHVLNGEVDFFTALTLNGGMVETLDGDMIDIAIIDNMLTVGGANIIIEDLYTTNGIIHVIDAVIAEEMDLPPLSLIDVATNAGTFTTLLAALDEAELTDTLANLESTFTVFAPTDMAFEQLLTEANIDAATLLADPNLSNILLYHVLDSEVDSTTAIGLAGMTPGTLSTDSIGISLNGDVLNINTASVTTPDVMAANGLIHVIDQVLSPPTPTDASGSTIVDVVVGDDRFDVLEAAVIEAGLATALADTDSTFTVFAPTDDAFTALLEALSITQEELLSSDILLPTLQLHVVADVAIGSVSAFAASGTNLITLGDAEVPVSIVDGELTVGGAIVTTFDIETDNGTIHIIDTVITQ